MNQTLLPAEIGNDREAQEVLESIFGMCRAVGSQMLVEGVETADQHDVLRALNCDYLQGFCFSRSLEYEKAREYIKSGK